MIVRASALKPQEHKISEEYGAEAAAWPLVSVALDEEDARRSLRPGFDIKGRLLELVVLVRDDGTEELIHAMKCRPQYFGMLG